MRNPFGSLASQKTPNQSFASFNSLTGFLRRRLSLWWSGLHIPHGFQRWSSSWIRCFYIWWMINSGSSSLNDKGPEEDTHWSPLWQTLPIYFGSAWVAMVCLIASSFFSYSSKKGRNFLDGPPRLNKLISGEVCSPTTSYWLGVRYGTNLNFKKWPPSIGLFFVV